MTSGAGAGKWLGKGAREMLLPSNVSHTTMQATPGLGRRPLRSPNQHTRRQVLKRKSPV